MFIKKEQRIPIGTLVDNKACGIGMIIKYGLNDEIYHINFPKVKRIVVVDVTYEISVGRTTIIK